MRTRFQRVLKGRLSPEAQAHVLGFTVMTAGIVAVASALSRPWRGRLRVVEDLLTPGATHVAAGAAALLGLALILVGRGVVLRRRVAYVTAIVLLTAAALADLVKGLDVEEAVFTAALAWLLFRRRQLFVVAPPPARLTKLARLLVGAVVLDFVYGLAGLATHARNTTPRLRPLGALQEVAARLVGLRGPLEIRGRFGHWFPASLSLLGLATVVGVLVAALAPVALRGGGPEAELDELRLLVDRADGDTLDPFIQRRDKRRVFSPDRRAALGYRYFGGVGLASGDPVGDPAAFPGAVIAFLGLCERMGWRPAIVGAREDRRALYEQLGLRSVYVGDEAIVDVECFSLAGRRSRNVRQAVNRSRNFGVTTEILREGELTTALRDQLLWVAAAQRGEAPEFGFSMALGDLLSGENPDCLVVVGRDDAGLPIGFQRYVPCRGGRALSIDAMRRVPGAPNGLNERLIVEVIDWAREHGIGEVSLNFAAFRAVLDEAADRDPLQAVEAWFIRRLEGRFGVQMDTLRRFNAKFGPRWVARHVVYRSPADLPAIGLAAFSAEGFLPFDRGRRPGSGTRRQVDLRHWLDAGGRSG